MSCCANISSPFASVTQFHERQQALLLQFLLGTVVFCAPGHKDIGEMEQHLSYLSIAFRAQAERAGKIAENIHKMISATTWSPSHHRLLFDRLRPLLYHCLSDEGLLLFLLRYWDRFSTPKLMRRFFDEYSAGGLTALVSCATGRFVVRGHPRIGTELALLAQELQ